MLLIVAHHYVVNSGLIQAIAEAPLTASSAVMTIFGAWGKIGINCFVLITGYFMCKSSFSSRKLVKLYLQILFYTLVIYGIFCITGHETFSPLQTLYKIFPIKNLTNGFSSCFLVFYLFIPFLNLFLKHLNKRHHTYLVILLITLYSIVPNIPFITFSFNYVEWFIALYFIASWLRFYGNELKISHRKWGYFALISIILSCLSILSLLYLKHSGKVGAFIPYHFVMDSNQILALVTGITSFMWFKDLKMRYYPLINTIGATTFGILLIHANSDAMRQWLWNDTIDVVGNFQSEILPTLGYALISVFIIFFICSFIDWLRTILVEPHILKFADRVINFLRFRGKYNIDDNLVKD